MSLLYAAIIIQFHHISSLLYILPCIAVLFFLFRTMIPKSSEHKDVWHVAVSLHHVGGEASSKKVASLRKDNSSGLYCNHFLKKLIEFVDKVKYLFFRLLREKKNKNIGLEQNQQSLYSVHMKFPSQCQSFIPYPTVRSTTSVISADALSKSTCYRNSKSCGLLIHYAWNLPS